MVAPTARGGGICSTVGGWGGSTLPLGRGSPPDGLPAPVVVGTWGTGSRLGTPEGLAGWVGRRARRRRRAQAVTANPIPTRVVEDNDFVLLMARSPAFGQ